LPALPHCPASSAMPLEIGLGLTRAGGEGDGAAALQEHAAADGGACAARAAEATPAPPSGGDGVAVDH